MATEAAAVNPFPEPPRPGIEAKAFRAKLDENGVYHGVEEVRAIAEGDVEVPADCDLAAGRYAWDGSTFRPLPMQKVIREQGAPSMEDAFYDLVQSIMHNTEPTVAHGWCRVYERSLDMPVRRSSR